MKTITISVLALCLLSIAFSSMAQDVKLTTAANRIMVADYLQGTNDDNPLLILHGFLQTREFSTVNRLAMALNEEGYTVLNPSLSLGLSNRKQSLSCEAIHTHSLDSDAAELEQWITWLHNKTGKPVTLIGHSAGGPVILKYMETNDATLINYVILISLPYYASGPVANETREHAERATKAIKQNTDPLDTYALSYCKTYPTRASAFLSYYQWDKSRVSNIVKKYNKKISIVIGTGDKRIDKDWLLQLQSQNSHVIPISGANHFFDQAHEFELMDTIEALLSDQADQ